MKNSRDNAQTEATRAEMDREYQRKAALLQKQNKAYNDYCAENNLKKRADRIAIAKWDRQQAAQARGAAKRYNNAVEKQEKYDKMVAEIKNNGILPKNAAINYPPRDINVSELSFNDVHINAERSHNVTREMAETWINESRISVTVWNGRFERYYSSNGTTYVEIPEKKIRTAFSSNEYDDKTKALLEVLSKYGY